MHNYAPMLTIWQGHCALRTPLPLGACGTYVHFVLYTLFSPFRRLCRRLPERRNLRYKERLNKLNLVNLELRRLQFDLGMWQCATK